MPRIAFYFFAAASAFVSTTALTASTDLVGSTLRLKRFDVVDVNTFGRPVTAASFLAPADWRLEGGVVWNAGFECPADMVAFRVRVSSPDGRLGFALYPNYMAQWSSDRNYNRMVAQAVQMAGSGCPVGPPVDAARFVAQVFAPRLRPGARLIEAQSNQRVAQEVHRKAVRSAPGARLQVDAARVRLAYADREEWVLATVMSSASFNPGIGGAAQSFVTATESVMSFHAPRGGLDAAEPILRLILSSMRVNPIWKRAVQQIQRSIAMAQLRAVGERTRLIAQAGDEFRAMSRDTWRRDQDARDYNSRRWSEVMRGTQHYADPDAGAPWELVSGYEHVWKAPNDEFILTNNPNFDPNIAFAQDSWSRLQALP